MTDLNTQENKTVDFYVELTVEIYIKGGKFPNDTY